MEINGEKTELRKLAALIEQRRGEIGLSKTKLCDQYGHLGSSKTYGRALDPEDDLENLDVAKQVANYRVAWELIKDVQDDPEVNKIYGDFGWMRDAMAALGQARRMTDNSRFLLITGGSGGGKSSFIQHVRDSVETARLTHYIEATEAWRFKGRSLIIALLKEVIIERNAEGEERARGVNYECLSSDDLLIKLVEVIDGRKVILAIDEGHHIGPEGYNIVKTIINQTRAVVVMTAIPDLLTRINKKRHAEAAQLFHNRMFKHIRIPPPKSGDVLEFLKRRGVKFDSEKTASAIAKKAADESPAWGLWKYIQRLSTKARDKGPVHFDETRFAGVIASVKNDISLGG